MVLRPKSLPGASLHLSPLRGLTRLKAEYRHLFPRLVLLSGLLFYGTGGLRLVVSREPIFRFLGLFLGPGGVELLVSAFGPWVGFRSI